MKLVPLTQGYFAKVDDADYERVMQFKWHVLITPKTKTVYAHRSIWTNGKVVKERMHRFIMGAPKGMEVDHVNGEGLDNQQINLRVCPIIDNRRNRSIQVNRRSTEYIGVTKSRNTFVARIWSEGRNVHLGNYENPKDAAKRYDKEALKLRGKFAKLNFPLV